MHKTFQEINGDEYVKNEADAHETSQHFGLRHHIAINGNIVRIAFKKVKNVTF